MYHYVQYMRALVLDGVFPGLRENLICFLFAAGMLLFGIYVFYRKQDKFVLYI